MPSLTWSTLCCCLTTLKLCQGRTVPNLKYAYGDFPDLLFVVPASFKLAQIGSFLLLHPLPCLTTFNIVWYLNGRELNNCCGVSSICNSLHIELHLTCSVVCCTLPCHASLNRTCIILVCASCHVHACAFTMLFVFSVLLLSSGNVAIVRIRSSAPVRLLHGLVLLPCGISGKMTATLDLTTIIAMLVALFYRYVA